jgi:hypothetical protein
MKLDELTFGGPYCIAQLRYIKDDGEYHRECRAPGTDLSDLPDDIRAQIEAEWTPEVITAYQEATKPGPEPLTRRRVPRRTIIERLAAAGLLDEAETALLAAPALTRWKWNTAIDGVYFDDPETLAFLAQINADPDVILAP